MAKIDEIINDAKTVGIAGHVRPDGDCIGSCMSLYNYLVKNRSDLDVHVYLEFVDEKYKRVPNSDKIVTSGYDGTVFDLFFALDSASEDRLGFNLPFLKNAGRTVCIDHHASNIGYGDENYIIPKTGSTSEVLYGMLDSNLFDKSIAEPMYMGIAHDSGVFRFQTTTPHTMRVAADLMEYGIDSNAILEETYYGKTYNQMIVSAKIQSSAVLTMGGKCVYAYCDKEMMDKYNVAVNDLDMVVSSIRNLAGIEVAVFLYQLDDGSYKASMRSKKYVDVSKIAVYFGGGGHERAAGFEMFGDVEEIIQKLLKKIEESI